MTQPASIKLVGNSGGEDGAGGKGARALELCNLIAMRAEEDMLHAPRDRGEAGHGGNLTTLGIVLDGVTINRAVRWFRGCRSGWRVQKHTLRRCSYLRPLSLRTCECVRETEILVEQQAPQGVQYRAGRVINEFS